MNSLKELRDKVWSGIDQEDEELSAFCKKFCQKLDSLSDLISTDQSLKSSSKELIESEKDALDEIAKSQKNENHASAENLPKVSRSLIDNSRKELQRIKALDDEIVLEVYEKTKKEKIIELEGQIEFAERYASVTTESKDFLRLATTIQRIMILSWIQESISQLEGASTDKDLIHSFQVYKISDHLQEWKVGLKRINELKNDGQTLLRLWKTGWHLLELLSPTDWLRKLGDSILELQIDGSVSPNDVIALKRLEPKINEAILVLNKTNQIWLDGLSRWGEI